MSIVFSSLPIVAVFLLSNNRSINSVLSSIDTSKHALFYITNHFRLCSYDLNDKPVILLLHNQIELTNEMEMNIPNEKLTSFIQNLSLVDKSSKSKKKQNKSRKISEENFT